MKSIKRNFLYNGTLTISGYLFPLLTYPYVSRVLGVSNIGICNFVDSIVNYFILLSMMGLSTVGMREISQHRDDRAEMSRHFSGLFLLNSISTIVAMIVLLIAIYTIQSFYPYRDLLYIGVCKLFFNLFLIEWFFAGIEDFDYITKRTIMVRLVYVFLIFICVQNQNDYKIYYLLTVSVVFINGLINIIYGRRFIDFKLKDISIRPYVGTFLTIGIYMLITNVYTSLNVTWLGISVGAVEVGYYTTATKLYTIILSFFSALTGVLYPRLTLLYHKRQMTEFWDKIDKATELVFAVSMPLMLMMLIFSSQIVHLISGDGYEGACTPLRIISPLILIMGYGQILVLQILFAMKQDKRVTYNSLCGALVTIGLSLVLVDRYGAIGTSIVWLTTEVVVMLLSLAAVQYVTSYRFPVVILLKNIAANLPLLAILYFLSTHLGVPDIIMLLLASSIVFLYSLFIQTKLLKNELVIQTFNKIRMKINLLKTIR